MFFLLCFPPGFPLQGFLEDFVVAVLFFFLSHLGLRVVVSRGLPFPGGGPVVSGRRGTSFRFDEGEDPGVTVHCIHVPAAATGVASETQLLSREGLGRSAVGCQHRDPRVLPTCASPLGTLTLRTKVP